MAKKGNPKLTPEEKQALRTRLREGKGAQGEAAVLSALASWPEPDRTLGERLHALIRRQAPFLTPRLWYGMPAYALEGKVLCFLQPAHKFQTRYATLGFTDRAQLEEGNMWPVAFGLKELGPAEEARIGELLRRALA